MIWTREDVAAMEVGVRGEPERSAGIHVERHGARSVFVFGTVLPWRGDLRQPGVRGGAAFERSLERQASDWAAAQLARPDHAICIAGDFNQELDADGPVGTRVGRTALARVLTAQGLRSVTAGSLDPLRRRGWRASIDHVLVSPHLITPGVAEVWPDQFPLPSGLPDHHGLCIRVADA